MNDKFSESQNTIHDESRRFTADLPNIQAEYKKMQSNYTIRESSGSSRGRVYQNRIQVEVSNHQTSTNSTKHIKMNEKDHQFGSNQSATIKQSQTAYGNFQTVSSIQKLNESSILQSRQPNKTLYDPTSTSKALQPLKQKEFHLKQSQFFNSASKQLNLSGIEIENNNKSLSSLLELGENFLEGPDAKGIKKRKGQFQTAQQKSRMLRGNFMGSSSTQYGQFQMKIKREEETQKPPENQNGSMNSLGKLALKKNVIGVDAIEKDRKDLDKFLLNYSNTTTLADKSRNYQERQNIKNLISIESKQENIPQSLSYDHRLNTSSNLESKNVLLKKNIENRGNQPYQQNENIAIDGSNDQTRDPLLHPQIIITNQRVNQNTINSQGHFNIMHRFSVPLQESQQEDENATYEQNLASNFDALSQAEPYQNMRAKSQNANVFTYTGTSRGERNQMFLKSGYQTANDFNLKRYKQNRSQLATTGQPSTRPIHQVTINSNSQTHYGNLRGGKSQKQQLKSLGLGFKQNLHSAQNQRSATGQASKLRFLMEENAIYQQDCDAKIDSVINQVMQDQNQHGSEEYKKLLKTIESINGQLFGEQAKFEMRFNLDLVFSGDQDIQLYGKQLKKSANENQFLQKDSNGIRDIDNEANQDLND